MTQYTVERLGHQGDGIVAGPLYVSGVLPGEVITGEVVKDRIVNPSIITPSEHRVKAPCSHARSCGGCNLQHASDEFVADFKKSVILQALKVRGIDTDIVASDTSSANSRRRAVFSVRRTKKGAMAGFHVKASDTVIPVPNCTILRPALKDAVPLLEELTVLGGSRKGEIRFTVTETRTGLDILAQGGKPAEGMFQAQLAQIAARPGVARLTWDDELIATVEMPVVDFDGALVTPPPGTFLQATEEGQNALISAVIDTIAGANHVADLFAGCGTFTLPAARNAEVHAFEGEKVMIDSLLNGWRRAKGLKMVKADARDLFRRPLMPDELNRFDAIIIDPPRAGAEAQIIEIAKSTVETIAMVSCNPVSFARDAEILIKAGYQMKNLRMIDQFRWSSHVEISAAFHR